MYTVHTYYLVQHPEPLSLPLTVVLLVLGILSVYINYDCDRQRQEFRETNGISKIWGKAPTYVVGEYTVDGKVKTSLLLTSGWWGLARHFHYIPEILASVFWCMPSLFAPNADFFAVAIFYPIYLTLLLTDRAWRDDKRCADKYGESWKVYCKEVPYKIIPGII
jgi:7-dehydrocholesterol reductase